MKDKHIIELLDNASFVSLSESELNEVRAHSRDCVSCRDAYVAAQLSSLVIRSRAESAVEPSPFFHTRVMAAIREQQAVENAPAILRLWRAASALVSTMAVTTAALAVMSFMLPAPAVTTSEPAVSAYSAESVILGQTSDEQMTYEQVMSTIYAEEFEAR